MSVDLLRWADRVRARVTGEGLLDLRGEDHLPLQAVRDLVIAGRESAVEIVCNRDQRRRWGQEAMGTWPGYYVWTDSRYVLGVPLVVR